MGKKYSTENNQLSKPKKTRGVVHKPCTRPVRTEECPRTTIHNRGPSLARQLHGDMRLLMSLQWVRATYYCAVRTGSHALLPTSNDSQR